MTRTMPFAQVIGDPIHHSKSPLIHSFWLDKLGLDADYGMEYVTPSGLTDYLSTSRRNEFWRGCNVTMPHKQAIIPLMDSLDPLVERVGAMNTVVKQPDGTLRGFNTDVPGFLEPLAEVLSEKHLFRMARILGTGGAARAIIAGLSDQGAVLVVAGRNTDKAQSLINELTGQDDHHVAPLDHFAQVTEFKFDDREGCLDIIVNASPLGMRGQPELQFDFSHAPPNSIVYDIVTDPIETAFLRNAKAAGFCTIDGYAMLIGQAVAAFEMFFGQSPPRQYDDELRARLMA
jgi:shikimate dehydrogenase